MPDDLEIDIALEPAQGEAAKESTVETVAEEAPDELIEGFKKQLADLQAQHESEKKQSAADLEAARVSAQRHASQAQEAEKRLERTVAELTESNVSVLDNAIAAAQAIRTTAERAYETAMSSADWGAAAKANTQVAEASARIAQLEAGKADLELRKQEAVKPAKEAQPEQRKTQAADPFEEIVGNLSPRTQTWFRAHPEYIKDQRLNAKANAAHYDAVDAGLKPDTDEYFAFCEEKLGLRQPKEQPQEQRAKAMPGAPVTRDGNVNGGQMSPTKVLLTRGEQQSATDGTLVWNYDDPKGKFKKGEPIGIQEMARRKQKMTQQGFYEG